MRISDWSSDVCSSDLNYDKLVDPVQGFIGHPDEREKADAWFNRMIYIEDEIEKRTKLFAPRNPKADAAMWRTKTKLLEERAAKRRKMEADAEAQPTCPPPIPFAPSILGRSEEHTSELQSLMRISYAVFCLNKKHIN